MSFEPSLSSAWSATMQQVEATPLLDDFMARYATMHVKPTEMTPVGDKFARLQGGYSDNEVYATANSVFFTTPKKLFAQVSDELQGDDFNRGEFMDGIRNIYRANDEMVWYFWLDQRCSSMKLEIAVLPFEYTKKDDRNKDGTLDAKLLVDIDQSRFAATWQASSENHAVVLDVSNLEAGLHKMVLQLDKLFFYDKGIGLLRYVRLTTNDATIKLARERWRPEALYTSHTSSKVKNIMSSIVDMHVDGKMGSYSPVLPGWTQYFGNSFNEDGSVDQKGCINFTMHAAKDNKPLPPTNEMPRFIRFGHPTASTGFYSHEGSGLKVAEYDTAFKNNTSKHFVYACRIEEQVYRKTAKGGFHRFFVAWFDEAFVRQDGELGKWKLLAVGERFRTTPPTAQCNTFNEKVGGRPGERSGHLEMGMDYLTYHAGADKVFHFGDRMTPSTRVEFANRSWSVEDGHFVTSAGGILNSRQSRKTLVLQPPAEQPNYIKFVSDLDEFGSEYPRVVSCQDKQSQAEQSQAEQSQAEQSTEQAGQTKQVDLEVYLPVELDAESCVLDVFSGPTDQLTFTTRWASKQTFSVDSQGAELVPGTTARVVLDIPLNTTTMLRLCARDTNMQIFSEETFVAQSAKAKRKLAEQDEQDEHQHSKRAKSMHEDHDSDDEEQDDFWF
jgi:hypothetical protein